MLTDDATGNSYLIPFPLPYVTTQTLIQLPSIFEGTLTRNTKALTQALHGHSSPNRPEYSTFSTTNVPMNEFSVAAASPICDALDNLRHDLPSQIQTSLTHTLQSEVAASLIDSQLNATLPDVRDLLSILHHIFDSNTFVYSLQLLCDHTT